MAIKFFKKNILDLTNPLVTVTVTDSVATNNGQSFVNLMRNRNNNSGWSTTASTDAANTTLVFDFGEDRTFDSIHLIKHNLKAFTLKYWNGSAWTNFSTAIAETTNVLTTNYYNFNSVSGSKLQLIITAAQTLDADKYINQVIASEIIGTMQDEPEIQPQWDKDRVVTKFLSGKNFVAKSVGGFNCTIKKKSVSNSNDLTLAETLFHSYEGFLVWICGGDTSQMETIREGYRLEDIFFMDVANEYSPEWIESRFYNGMPLNLKLVEVA